MKFYVDTKNILNPTEKYYIVFYTRITKNNNGFDVKGRSAVKTISPIFNFYEFEEHMQAVKKLIGAVVTNFVEVTKEEYEHYIKKNP